MIREREGQAAKRLQQVLSNAKKAGIVEADAMLDPRRPGGDSGRSGQ